MCGRIRGGRRRGWGWCWRIPVRWWWSRTGGWRGWRAGRGGRGGGRGGWWGGGGGGPVGGGEVLLGGGDDGAVGVAAGAAELAYVMYTSGSTGVPKGGAVTRGAVAALAADGGWVAGGGVRVLMHAPHAFDASTYEVWVPLLSGGQVVVAPPGTVDAGVLGRLIGGHGLSAVPV